jgi:hypothetical protein
MRLWWHKPVNDYYDYYDDDYNEKPKRGHEPRRWRLPLILAVTAGICGVLVCVGILAFIGVETLTVRNRYGVELASMCDPPTGGAASRDNYPYKADGVRFLILDEGIQMRDLWHGELPDDWKANSADEVDIVMCMDDRWVELDPCPIPGEEDSRNLEQHVVDVVLLNADSGRRIIEHTFRGSEPDCPKNDTGAGRLRGSEVEVNDFVIWFEAF